jgi:hypothetical protein
MSAALDISGTVDLVLPDSEPWIVKAFPREEGGKRIVYVEASNEQTDLQGEKVLQAALWESRDYFIKKGNLDIDHLSKVGLKLKPPIEDYYNYEIGRPLEVDRSNGSIWVKGVIYQGNPHAEAFWASLHYEPPQQWMASVAGAVLGRARRGNVSMITKCRWNNLGFSNEAVNHRLRHPASTEPAGPFSKATILEFAKALTAGYGTDTATLEGGGALRRESRSGKIVDPYQRYRNYASKLILKGGGRLSHERFTRWARECGYSQENAQKVAKRFLDELLPGGR